MAFQVRELMVTLEPGRIACGLTEGQCPTASAGLFVSTTTKPPCSCVYPSSVDIAAGSGSNLELLRQHLAQTLN
jgi:hypothetical protein